MTRATKPLSGAAKDRYFRRLLAREADLPEDVEQRVRERLRDETSQVRIRTEVVAARLAVPRTRSAASSDAPASETLLVRQAGETPCEARAFDPFTPNVILVLRTQGLQPAFAALQSLTLDQLRILAREQQLGIDETVSNKDAVCNAVLEAAERRIANRRAAFR